MPGSSAKNYHVNGDKMVIGGVLNIVGEGQIQKNGVPIDIGGGGSTSVSWSDVTGKPAVIAAGADQATARAAIGAGTSSLVLGTTGTTAAAGNHTHAAATTGADGFMSSADKTKLNGVAANAVDAAGAVAAMKAKAQIAALTPIADPATADAPTVATLLNSVIAALKA